MFQISRKQKAVKSISELQLKRCSDGSFEIVDFEETPSQDHPSPLLSSHIMEEFRMMSRENSSEDFIVVVRNDSPTSSGVSSVCNSLSTLAMSTDSCQSVTSSLSSVDDAWDRQEKAPPPSDTPPSSRPSWASSRVSGGSRERQENGFVYQSALQSQCTKVECSSENEKDGTLDYSTNSSTKTSDTKTLNKGVTNMNNNFDFASRPAATSHTFPRQTPNSSSSSYYSDTSQAAATLRLTKSNSPLRPGDKSTAARSGQKKHSSHSLGSSSLVPGGCGRTRGAGEMYLKKPLDVNRALSEPNEKNLVDLAQLVKVQPLEEWLFKPCAPGANAPQNSASMREVSSSPELQQLRQGRTPPTEEAIKKCIEKYSADFLQYTNWKCLFPYLMSNQLLDQCAGEILNNEMTTSKYKGIKFYYEVLPSKGREAYSRYYLSVSQEKEHIGHQTLVELLDEFGETF